MLPLPPPQAAFASRHIGLNDAAIDAMLDSVGVSSLTELLDTVIPENIRRQSKMALQPALSEHEILAELKVLASKNQIKTSLIGMGYYNCHTPPVIQRNILENPAWYTAYTPYQPEISQGRLEAILNFQTMVMDLTGMDIANGSLLDEATAAAEGMALAHRMHKPKGNRFIVDPDTHPQTIAILKTRAKPLGIIIDVQPIGDTIPDDCFGGLLSYPGSCGAIRDLSGAIATIHDGGGLAVVCADLLALALLTPPGEMGADIVVGSTQRFGVPFGFGGPHAAYFACSQPLQRSIPGRLLGSHATHVAGPPIGSPCKRVNSIFAAKRPLRIFAQHRHCWRLWQVFMRFGTGRKDCKILLRIATVRHAALLPPCSRQAAVCGIRLSLTLWSLRRQRTAMN